MVLGRPYNLNSLPMRLFNIDGHDKQIMGRYCSERDTYYVQVHDGAIARTYKGDHVENFQELEIKKD